MSAMKEIKERKDIRWVIYTDLLSSILAIENNRENHPILNQIYDIQLKLCKVCVKHTQISYKNIYSSF